jgi:hypothetical protein
VKGKFSNQHSIALTIHFQNIMVLPSQQYDTNISFLQNFKVQSNIPSKTLFASKNWITNFEQ